MKVKTRKTKSIEDLVTKLLEVFLALCLLTIAAVVVSLVVLRYCFNSSITGANEFITVIFVFTTAIGAAVAVGRREHISIPFAVQRLSKSGRVAAEALSLVLVATLNAVMVAYSIGWIRITGDYLMPSTGLPRSVVQISVPIGCGLAVLYCMLRLWTVSDDSASFHAEEQTK